jgi:hypothetical protein
MDKLVQISFNSRAHVGRARGSRFLLGVGKHRQYIQAKKSLFTFHFFLMIKSLTKCLKVKKKLLSRYNAPKRGSSCQMLGKILSIYLLFIYLYY